MPEEAIMPQELVGYCERQVCSPMKSSSLHAHIFLDIYKLGPASWDRENAQNPNCVPSSHTTIFLCFGDCQERSYSLNMANSEFFSIPPASKIWRDWREHLIKIYYL
jgi:hypothetical protein